MNENISIKSKAGNVIFQLPASEIENAAKKENAGEFFYLLEYDYAQDLLLNNKDPEEVITTLKGICHIIAQDIRVEEVFIFVSTDLDSDMIELYAAIEHGSILSLDQNGTLIADLQNKNKASFSAIDDSELADIQTEIGPDEAKQSGEYVDPADFLIKMSKEQGLESYGRKDVIRKREEENKS